MPQAIAAVGAWVAGAITYANVAVAGAVVAASEGAIGLGAAVALGSLAAATVDILGLSTLAKLLNPPKPKGGLSGQQLSFQADPNAGIPFLRGRTATGGNIVFQYPSGANNRFLNMFTVISGHGPLKSFVDFLANKVSVAFDSNGAVTTSGSKYANKMWLKVALGVAGAAAFTAPAAVAAAGGTLAAWTENHKLSRFAADYWVMDYDQTVYAEGVPPPLRIWEGGKVYDPRLDSTYPGGSGSHRADDPDTWGYESIGNPFIEAVTYALGYWVRDDNDDLRMQGGIGMSPAEIDFPAFVEGANVCDANGWKMGCVFTSLDSKAQVLQTMLQAGSGEMLNIGALLSCRVDTPRSSLATLTEADIKGPVSINAVKSVRDRKNTIVPSFRSPDHDWQIVQGGAVSVSDYVTADGAIRQEEIEFSFCQDAGQAAQLAAYQLVNAREFGPITLACRPSWLGYKPGDCITLDLPTRGLTSQKVLITDRALDYQTGTVSLTCQSETDAKHDYALGRTGAPPPTPGLDPVDFTTVAEPAVDVWAAAAGYLTSGVNAVPAVTVVGVADNKFARQVEVLYRVHGTDDVVSAGLMPAAQTAFTITGLDSGTTYDIGVRYISVLGVPGVIRWVTTVTTGGVNADMLGGVSSGTIIDGLSTTSSELLKNTFRDSIFRQVQDGLNHDGLGRSTKLIAIEALDKSDTSIEKLDLIGAVNEAGDAFVFNGSSAMIDGTTSLATYVAGVQSDLDGHTASISENATTIDGFKAKWTLSLNVDGHIAGIESENDGTVGQVNIVADVFRIINPDAPDTFKTPFAYDGTTGAFYITGDVEIRGTLSADTITTDNLIANAAVKPFYHEVTTSAACGTDSLTYTFTLDYDGLVEISGNVKFGADTGHADDTTMQVVMDSTEVQLSLNNTGFLASKFEPIDAPCGVLTAGSHTVHVNTVGDSRVTVTSVKVFIKHFPKTSI